MISRDVIVWRLIVGVAETPRWDVSTSGGIRGCIMLRPLQFQLFQFQLFFCGVFADAVCVYVHKRVRMNFLGFFLAYIKYGRYICGDLTRCLKKAEESIIFIFISYRIHSSWEECIFFIACWRLFAFEFLFLLLSLHWKNTFC